MEKNTAQVNGALLINKEAGVTSHDVVADIRHIQGMRGVKVGHSGTLDPFATGVLTVLLGHATRLQDELHLLPKTYRATLTLGGTSDTDDSTGVIAIKDNAKIPTEEEVLSCIENIKKQTSQIPPSYAAIKVGGKKLYEYARKGESVERKARPITIHEIKMENYAYPTLQISVTCSTGTYIRSIARDIGETLTTGAYCSTLERTAIGSFTVENSHCITDLPEDLTTALIPLEQLVSHIPCIEFSDENVAKLKNGREVENEENTPINTSIALFDTHQKLFGIGIQETEKNTITPKKIFL
jgi:tRNA pseudouridine55 synthase